MPALAQQSEPAIDSMVRIILFSFVLLQSCATPGLGEDAEKRAIAKETLKEVQKWFEKLQKRKYFLSKKSVENIFPNLRNF